MRTRVVRRLTEIDALRGLAALAVMAFHYTTKYDELFRFARARVGVNC